MPHVAATFHDRSGSAAVEFALVGPLFAWLLIGLTVYGGWFWLAQGVQTLAAEGARAAVAGLDAAERETLARAAISAGAAGTPALEPEEMDVQVLATGSEIRVSVTYPAGRHPVMALAGLVPSPPAEIRRVAVVRTGGY